MATVIELRDQQTTVVQMHLDTVMAQGQVQPRLIFAFQGETKGRNVHAEVLLLRVEVTSNGEYLGSGTQRNVATDIFGYLTQVRVEVPITRAVLEFIDRQQRDAADVRLQLELQAFLRLRTEVPAPPGQTPPEPGPWREVKIWPIQVDVAIPRSEWITRVVQPLGVEQYVLLEIALPPAPDRSRWEQALAHLAAAEQRYREGNDPEVLQRCYAAFEALEGAPAAIFETLPDKAKGKRLDDALRTAKAYMNSGRHVSATGEQMGEYPVDHRDAAFTLGQAKLWLSYISHLLQKA